MGEVINLATNAEKDPERYSTDEFFEKCKEYNLDTAAVFGITEDRETFIFANNIRVEELYMLIEVMKDQLRKRYLHVE